MLLNRRGVSIVEFLMAFGLLAVVATGVATIQRDFMNDVVRGEKYNDMNYLHIKLRRALTVRGTCNRTFRTLPLATSPIVGSIRDADNRILYQSGVTYEKDVTIQEMRVQSYAPSPTIAGERQFELEVTYNVQGLPFLSQSTKRFLVYVKVTAGVFESCFTAGDIGTDAEYLKELGDDTFRGRLTILGALDVLRNGAGTGGIIRSQEFLQTSDRNLKSDIHKLSDPLSMLKKIKAYYYIKHDTFKEYGFMAQDFESWTPLTHRSSDDVLSLKYLGVIPVGFEGVKAVHDDQNQLLKKIRKQKEFLKKISQDF